MASLAPDSVVAGLELISQTTRNDGYSTGIALTILVYDTILMFPQEVLHIWSSAWSFPKALYIFVRYYAILHLGILLTFDTLLNVPHEACTVYFWMISLTPVAFDAVINIIFIMAIYAIYERNKNVLASLTILVGVQFIVFAYVTVQGSNKTTQGIFSIPNFNSPGCLTRGSPSKEIIMTSWIVLFFSSVVMFMMTSFKFFQNRRLYGKIYASPLLSEFVKDRTIYFLVITAVLAMAITMEAVAPVALGTIPLSSIIGVYSFAGSHIVLDLRNAAEDVKNGGLSPEETILSGTDFNFNV